MTNTEQTIGQYFAGYGAAVAQSRALISAEDGLKPSLRQALYANYTDKYVGKKKKAKFLKIIGSAARFCWHGDASTYGMLIRAAKPFAMRYPLYGAQGSYGSLMDPDNHSAARYIEGYISEVGVLLFQKINEGTITEWRDNYDNTEQFPQLLPSIGFWNICNGTTGIGVGMASSVPQFNLREMNTALVQMLKGEDFTIPLPDFATGGVLLNAEVVRESLEKGQGASCKLRAKINYDEKKRMFTVYELPYATYTNTICKELETLMSDPSSGIETFIDVTGTEPNIQIEIKKDAVPSEVLSLLFSKTSLQNNFGINLTMLEKGRYPKVFTLREAMQAHLDHERICYKRSFEFQLRETLDRIHILRGLIIACAHIEEIIQVIKKSADRADAKIQLTNNFELSLLQADAILKLTLSRIASLEAKKFVDEKEELEKHAEYLENVINSEELMNKEIIKGLEDVARKFGDNRRTELLNVEEEVADKLYYFTSEGKVGFAAPKVGTVIGTLSAGQPYLVVTYNGIVYRSNEQPKRLKQVFKLNDGDRIIAVFPDDESKFLTFLDKEKHFRCKDIASLNKGKTTLSLSKLQAVYFTAERTTKGNYKEIINKK